MEGDWGQTYESEICSLQTILNHAKLEIGGKPEKQRVCAS